MSRSSRGREGESCVQPLDEPRIGSSPTKSLDRLELIRLLWHYRSQSKGIRDVDKVLRAALKLSLDYFQTDNGCIATIRPSQAQATIQLGTPREFRWDTDLLTRFLRGDKVQVPANLMLARLRRFGRMWGTIVVRSHSSEFDWNARQGLSTIGSLVEELTDAIDLERVREVRAHIDQKILEQVRPKHLFYKLLHGIRSLTSYDHSAALLIYDRDHRQLEVVAEKITWRKSKGNHVGWKRPLSAALVGLLEERVIFGFDRQGEDWTEWTSPGGRELAQLLDFRDHPNQRLDALVEGSMILAPLTSRSGLIGVLKVASIANGAFCNYEADLISQFLPQAAIALQNMARAENLEQQVVAAERKSAMADLARGVAHDVNNALGAVLPLVQQLEDDLRQGVFDPNLAYGDLEQIERSIKVCHRIFGGMLAFARNTTRNPSEVSLMSSIDAALAIFRQGLEQRGILVEVDLPPDLPTLKAVQADIDQLLLNFIANAKDATSPGDFLKIRVDPQPGSLQLVVQDSGCGIPPELLAKVQEPFFTTKKYGSGLGLAICRSIMAHLRGSLAIKSLPGQGTTVIATFPIPVEGGT